MEGTAGQSLQGCPTVHHLSSSQSLRVLWALEEPSAHSGQRYTLKTCKHHMGRAPAVLKSVFPLGKSPILVVDPTPRLRSNSRGWLPRVASSSNISQTIMRKATGSPSTSPAKSVMNTSKSLQIALLQWRLILSWFLISFRHILCGLWDHWYRGCSTSLPLITRMISWHPLSLWKPRCRIRVLGLQDRNWVWPISVWVGRWTWLRNGDILMKSSTPKWPIGIGEFVNARPTKQLWLKVAYTILSLLTFRCLVLFRFTGICPACSGANRPG